MNLNLKFVVFILSFILSFVSLTPLESGLKDITACLKCHEINNKKINVHLIPHSHDDVGWLKTVDQYFYGLNNSIYTASVQTIISSVVEALNENPDRRFIQVETAYFWKWWQEQSQSMRDKFVQLVNNGQIEMVNGGWSMNDEACTNYQSTIDQFTYGLKILKDSIGTCGIPRIGWQIDPFGHSREQASIFSQLGYDGVFFARLDRDDKAKREAGKSLEFAWQGSANLPNKTIFGGIFPTSLYYPPAEFCWDYNCDDDSIDDDPNSSSYNLKEKIELFSNYIQNYSKYYQTNNIPIPMGGDFQFAAAESNYINMDKLIKAFKNDSKVNVIYSTPSCYLQAVHAAKPKLNLKVDDFFPYSDEKHSFWTGYFSSRPTIKRLERMGHNILQGIKQIVALKSIYFGRYASYERQMNNLREVMATFQHHDAITGTEKQHVANDYVRQLSAAIYTAEQPLGAIIRNLTKDAQHTLELSSCLLLNVSVCAAAVANNTVVVVVYNPLAFEVSHYIRMPLPVSAGVAVRGLDGQEKCDIVPPLDPFDFFKAKGTSPSTFELVFLAKKIPPFGFKMYSVVTKSDIKPGCSWVDNSNAWLYGNNRTNFEIDNTTNLLKSVRLNGKTVKITQNLYYYDSASEKKDNSKVHSGAYLFRPDSNTPIELATKVSKFNAFRGIYVNEFHQWWKTDENMLAKQVIRVYENEDYVEFDWLVGNITIDGSITGKEIVSKFTILDGFNNKNTFFTDSNGREMIKRVLNKRSDYHYDPTVEPVSSNYYPITSKIVIKDDVKDLEVAVLNDRSQGGTSLRKGEIELMIHRRLLRDDHKGVEESLNETEFGESGVYVRGSHYLVLGKASGANPNGLSTAAQERILAQRKLVQPYVVIAKSNLTHEKLEAYFDTVFSPLDETQIPAGINIITLENWDGDTYLLRLEHFLEKDEDSQLSTRKEVDLRKIFKGVHITDIQETTLGANQPLEEFKNSKKYSWDIRGTSLHVADKTADKSQYEISLDPMEIRTFIVKFAKGSVSFGNVFKPIFCLVLPLFFTNLLMT